MEKLQAKIPDYIDSAMRYVYLIKSSKYEDQVYIGSTNNMARRIAEHNAGKSPYTAKYRPWVIKSYVAFTNQDDADDFEKYLKTGSGREFSRRHFL